MIASQRPQPYQYHVTGSVCVYVCAFVFVCVVLLSHDSLTLQLQPLRPLQMC